MHPALVALLGLACVACTETSPRPAPPSASPPTTVYDLAARAWAAELTSPRRTALLGTPSGDPFLEGGFTRAALPAQGAPFAWARRRAVIALHGVPDDARALVLDLEPAPGLARQALRVFLRGVPVGSLALRNERRGYRFALPASPAGPGVPLQLFFDAAADAADARPGHHAWPRASTA